MLTFSVNHGPVIANSLKNASALWNSYCFCSKRFCTVHFGIRITFFFWLDFEKSEGLLNISRKAVEQSTKHLGTFMYKQGLSNYDKYGSRYKNNFTVHKKMNIK